MGVVSVTVKFKESERAWIDRLAEEEEITASAVIRKALRAYRRQTANPPPPYPTGIKEYGRIEVGE